MGRDWDATFEFWGAPLSNTEHEKCNNAEVAIRKAIAASPTLSSKQIEVFVQGSFANGTNVRQDSDVDVCVLYKQAFFPNYSQTEGLSNAVLGFPDGQYPYSTFKNDVEAALVARFGRPGVRRGKKALDIRENTYRVDADVVPCFEHRLYSGNINNYSYRSGTQLIPDDGNRIANWPKQNYDNGVAKDERAGRRFKQVARIFKNLRFDLMDEGDKIAETIPSYLIECLVWNVPDQDLSNGTLKQSARAAIIHLWNQTKGDTTCDKWTEVNGVKYLFHSTQPWSRQNVNSFLKTAWNHFGFA